MFEWMLIAIGITCLVTGIGRLYVGWSQLRGIVRHMKDLADKGLQAEPRGKPLEPWLQELRNLATMDFALAAAFFALASIFVTSGGIIIGTTN